MSTIPHNPQHAWRRAAVYFTACFTIAALSGAIPLVISRPLATLQDLQNTGWILFTLLCVAVEIWAYVILWPRGTQTHGRRLYWSVVLTFGIAWGLAEGLLFLSVFLLVSRIFTTRLLAWLVSFLVIGTFIGLWHEFYWDIYVAPEHNIREWNARKVLFGHIPNIMLTLAYLAVYENAGIFILFQAFALVASTYFMRFPPFWKS